MLIERAVVLAERLLTESIGDATRSERRQLRTLGRLIDDEQGRELVHHLTDDVLRIRGHKRAARRFCDVVTSVGIPSSLNKLDGLMLRLGAVFVPRAPRLLMPLVARRIRRETRGVVLSANDPAFADHVHTREAQHVRLNINVLGEAILSDAEADRRLETVRARLARADVNYISVKISALCANLDPLAFDHSVARVCARLRLLYADALAKSPSAFVNLDMEEFKDLHLTVASFMRVLDEDAFVGLDAGIVLQAYLPDSHEALEELGNWAVQRFQRSGGRIKIRLVKGANLAMEQVDAEQHGWNQAPYSTKADVDASYKALLASALRPEWASAVRVGLASHNLFDIAWALVLRDEIADPRQIEFEMLEGMAPAQSRAVNRAAQGLLLYAPVVAPSDVDSSIAYLSRRLDENTSPENFLRALFRLQPGSKEFHDQADRFRRSVAERTCTESRRLIARAMVSDTFSNDPESDFTLASTRTEILGAADDLAPSPELITTKVLIDEIMARAAGAALVWATSTTLQRCELLDDVASEMDKRRASTLAIMAQEAGKTIREGDPEISEAIDFAHYYGCVGTTLLDDVRSEQVSVTPRGVILVVAPWNFPYAIAAGGVCAAIAAGNAVILKPAPEARRTAWALANHLWEAGVSRSLLQYVACEDDHVGQHLVTHHDVATVVLTGSYETASLFTRWKPDMRLLAETSGKNALVITAAADIDAALRDLVRSAFGHAGQKCSAASLAIVEASVYDDPVFHQRLRDAVLSLVVGWPHDPATMMGPVIHEPSGALARALTSLDAGESWLVKPELIDPASQARLWSPGVRVGVQPDSWFHRTECFGPVLGVMRADDLNHAIQLQNATPYGLTGGIHSLDPVEIGSWLEQVEVGNAYVNRHITGAVVQRQPFGGWKRSSVGCGAKAGGPDYVLGLTNVRQLTPLDLDNAAASYRQSWHDYFMLNHDPSGLKSERNVLRYRPIRGVLLRFDSTTPAHAVELAHLAARICGVSVFESNCDEETDTELLNRLDGLLVERVRCLRAPSVELGNGLAARGVGFDISEVTSCGRVELARWLKEQSISETTHRYGRLTTSAFADDSTQHGR